MSFEKEEEKIIEIIENNDEDYVQNNIVEEQKIEENINYNEDEKLPIFTIYFMEKNEEVIEQINSIRSLLRVNYLIYEKDMVDVNITNDYELISYITTQCGGKLVLPIVMCKRKYIGKYDDLIVAHNNREIKALLDDQLSNTRDVPQLGMISNIVGDEQTSNKEVPQLGMISKAIESVDHLFTSLNPLKLFSKKKDTDISDMEIFEVIHTNWYNRSLTRKFHFGEKVLMRVNPYNNDVRAVQPYDDIENVTRTDKNNIIIKYKTGASSDYIKASEQDIERMLTILSSKTKIM